MSEKRPDGGPAWPPLYETGLSVAELDLHGGALFWEAVRAFTDESPLASLVQETLAAASVPRVWLLLDEPQETATRAAAALAAARALVARKLTVIVIDGDDRRPDLTRWSGRHEREGWVDFVRYGASLSACAVPLPWEEATGRLLGVGSFVPTDASGGETSWLLSLLGGQADVVLISAPFGPAGALWAPTAGLRLLCWDRASRGQTETAALLAEMVAQGRPAHGIVTFGAPGLELLPPPTPAVLAAERSLARFAAEIIAAGSGGETATILVPPSPGAAARVADVPDAPDQVDSPVGRPAGDGTDAAAAPTAAPPRRRRARPLLALLGVLVALAVAWAVWGRTPRRTVPLSSLAPPGAAEDISRPTVPGAGAADTARGDGAAPGDSLSPAGAPVDSVAGTAAASLTTPPVAAPASGAQAPAVAPAEAARTPASDFDPAPFALPVGRDGWALHVYSLPDSVQAGEQVADLARLGITSSWRGVELPDKGRWYRVYMGSFPSREAARAALPALLRRLGEDWGQVARF